MFNVNKLHLLSFRVILLGFLLVILAGAGLLSLPWAAADGQRVSLLDALFTSTSAVCVTGLIVRDTAAGWSLFGKSVILLLIQIGGLGVVTTAAVFSAMLGKRISLLERSIVQDSVSAPHPAVVMRFTQFILAVTLVMELIGAVLLLPDLAAEFGLGKGAWMAVFHSVSAFCNAGFDLMGGSGAYVSMTPFSGDALVTITLIVLILVGGLGFVVWADLTEKRLRVRHWRLQTKVVLAATAVLVLVPAVLFFLMERSVSGAGRSTGEQILCALFNSVTPRTAGMSTVDLAALSDGSKLLTAILMFIGGCPGSTAGGVKTVTVVVALAFLIARFRGSAYVGMFGRRVPDDAVSKAFTAIGINLVLGLSGTLIITASGFGLSDAMLEAFSAIGTVGLSTGITRELGTVCRLLLILLMYCGRLGSVSFATALLEKRSRPPVTAPAEELLIG
jgi:trk system potassium uptake protein TrkH